MTPSPRISSPEKTAPSAEMTVASPQNKVASPPKIVPSSKKIVTSLRMARSPRKSRSLDDGGEEYQQTSRAEFEVFTS